MRVRPPSAGLAEIPRRFGGAGGQLTLKAPMKEDIPPLPDRVPRKRRQVEGLLDVHIAMWLAGDLATSDRKRLEAEKARRKALVPEHAVGLLVGDEGVTPQQHEKILELMAGATTIHHPGVQAALHSACKRTGVPVYVHRVRPPNWEVSWAEAGMREVVKECNLVIAAPKEHTPSDAVVWTMARYARHRSVAVKIILPTGKTTGFDGT